MSSPLETGMIGVYPVSGNSQIDPLVWRGFKWGTSGAGTAATVTYSFPTSASVWSNDYALYLDNEPFNNFEPFTAAQQTAARKALALWSEVANVTFVEITETSDNVGDIRFGNSGSVTQDPLSAAWAYLPFDDASAFEYPENGDIWFDRTWAPNLELKPGQVGFLTMLHEIGHALGLDHPFTDYPYSGDPALPPDMDTDKYTVMSYADEPTTLAYASTPQLLDLLAIQYIYGANMTTRTGDDTYQFSSTAEVNRTIWDAGGNDTLDFSNQTSNVTGVLEGGQYLYFAGHPDVGTTSLVGIAYGVTIENVIGGSGGNLIYGNDAANRLIGGSGNDHFAGWGGDDYLEGYDGDDILDGGDGVNWVDGGAGDDFVFCGPGHGSNLFGGSGHDFLAAGSGNDYLNGGAGNDSMSGAEGNDIYVVDDPQDSITEIYSDTDDSVRATVSIDLRTLGEGLVEHCVLLGSTALNAIGNAADNKLTGNGAANKLYGGGGHDTMVGGNGSDTYRVNGIGDQVIEATGDAAGGADLVMSSVSYTLGDNVENLTLSGGGDVSGTGNALNNTLVGNSGSNRLDGAAGNDTMIGGKGNDIYVVSSASDVVIETVLNGAGGGVDTVESLVTFKLATHSNIEKLTLVGSANTTGIGNALANTIAGNGGNNKLDGGAGADLLTGGAGNDTLLGNGGNDILIGGNGNDWLNGGAGNDQMKGGAGNDIYVLDSIGDSIDEEGNADSDDIVRTLISVNLATLAGGAIEHAVLLGAGSIKAIGNGEDNRLTGNDGANLLDGGKGADTMIGGKGADIYVVEDSHDQVIEMAAGGIDLVRSTRTYVLEANVENATLIGKSDIDAFGNDLNNVLIGNDGGNELVGFGGADTMVGGKGNDTYIVDNAGDVVIESIANSKGGGFDSVISVVTFSLATHANIEDLYLGDLLDINGTGNALDNRIMGGSGNNRLIGGGGNDLLFGSAGADTLTGGLGSDVFWYSSLTDGGGDRITDFQKGNGGDVLSLGDLMHYIIGIGSTAGVFADGYLSFQSSGANTRVLIDADGGMDNPFTLVTLANVTLTQADTANYTI